MTLPLIVPVSPASGAANVPTGSSVQLRVTQLSAEALIDESTIELAVGGADAITVEFYAGDGAVQGGTSRFQSLFARLFTTADIGKSLFFTSANPRNNGKAWITNVVAPNVVDVERPALTGTVKLNAGASTIIGTGTAFLTEVVAGDWLILNRDYTNPLQVLSVMDNSMIILTGPSVIGYTDPTYPSGVSIQPAFHTNASLGDWRLQSFAAGFSGTIKPYVSGPTKGFTVEAWPVRQLSGTLTVPQPMDNLLTGTTLAGTSTKFLSELHQNARVSLLGKRTDEDPITIPSVTTDGLVTISAHTKQNTPLIGFRDADLAGLPTAAQTIAVVCVARDTLSRHATIDPLPVSQPVSSYSFSTSTRPRVASVDPQVVNPFGLGLRVLFSENMLAYALGTNTPIKDPQTYHVVPVDPSDPLPTVTSVAVPAGNPSYVDLTFSTAMVNQKDYTVTVQDMGLRASSTNKLALSPYNALAFKGFGPAETVEVVKDTVVGRPDIGGPTLVDYQGSPLAYEIHNLDPDVVAIQLGASASNVEIVAGSFANHGDGNGTFTVSFASLSTSFKVSIEAIDDVDNVSLESNVIGVTAKAETVPGTNLQIRPQFPVHKDTCDRLMADIPAGTFYLRAGFVLPYQLEAIPFTVKVLDRGVPVSIAITREGPTGKPETVHQSLVPQHLTETVMLVMGRGRNLIYVTDGTHHDFIIVSATTYATVLCSIANEIYSYSQIELDELNNAIYSPVSSRLAEPYLAYPELLPTPSVRSQQTLALKLAVRAHVSDAGSNRAVNDMSTAISLQTSPVVELHNPRKRFQPMVDRVYTAQEAFGGFELHTWYHNECMNRWDTFVRHIANSPERLRPIRITEDEVIMEDDTGTIRRHLFDFSDPACSSLSSAINCFDNIQIKMAFFGDFTIPICAATYPFDSCFTPYNPLGSGRISFDSPIPWDSGEPLDYDMLEPGDDGWVGLCWADRWDSGVTEASMVLGHISLGSSVFEDTSVTFDSTYVGKWVRITSGSRPGLYQILALVSANKVRLDTTFDVAETSLTWDLVRDLHQLDSSGFAPANALISVPVDGSTIAGSDTFTSFGYEFTTADVGRSLVVTNSFGGPISVTVTEILEPYLVRVGRSTGTDTADYLFARDESGLSWELWDPSPPRCVFDGYATKMVALASSDLTMPVSTTTTITLDGLATTMNRFFAGTGAQTHVFQNGGINNAVTTIPVNTIKTGLPTTLSGPINNAVTTIPVVSTVGFPSSGVIQIDSEQISYAGVTGVSFTGATRAYNGTVAASHLSAADVARTFPLSGTLMIGGEILTYTGTTTTSFTGATRGTNGTTASTHAGGLYTTLSAPITGTATTASVVSTGTGVSATLVTDTGTTITVGPGQTAGFPSSGVIHIASERIAYASKNTSQFLGLTRGLDGTAQVSQTPGAAVIQPLFPVVGTLFVEAEQLSYAGMTPSSFTGIVRGINSTTAASHLSGVATILQYGEPVTGITITTVASTPNRNGVGSLKGNATVIANARMSGSLGPAHLAATASIILASAHVDKDAMADIEGRAYVMATGTGGTDVDTATAVIGGYGWISGQPVADYAAQASLLGKASIAGALLSQFSDGSTVPAGLYVGLLGEASITAVGSVS